MIGAKRSDQLRGNLAAMELELAEDEMTLLDDVNTFPPEYPGWMLAVPGAGRLGALDRPV
jgi:hypothetical protein